MRQAFALALAAIAAGALACSAPAFAASTPTAQATYYGLSWVPFIDPVDLPPLDERPVVCIVDTGAAVTPDLPADDANGHFVARWALDGGTPGPFSQSATDIHGTLMATYAFGADNGWGITGVFPQGRVMEVRAQLESDGGIAYGYGVRSCRERTSSANLRLAAISLSLGGSSADADERLRMSDEIAEANMHDYPIIAAAGNTPGPVLYPGAFDGVFTVAAGVVGAANCSYAAEGSQVDLFGPSCGITDVDPFTGAVFEGSYRGGSSMATASVSAVVALLRTFRPTASISDIKQWLVSGATSVSGRPVLNGVGAMNAAGLSDVVVRAQAREQLALRPPDSSDPPITPIEQPKFKAPKASVKLKKRLLRVHVRNRPRNAVLVVRAVYSKGEFSTKSVWRSARKNDVKLKSRHTPRYVELRYERGTSTSAKVRFKPRRNRTFVQVKIARAP